MPAGLVVALVLSILAVTPATRADDTSFHLPPGFTIQKIAAPPLVQHPMMACFDERGRLFVCDAAGQNLKYDDLVKNPPNRIVMLEDTDNDGVFDKSTVFADKMTFPMGCCWYDGALYTASPPSFWRLKDTDGDGVADVREELVSEFGSNGNAADVHGPFLSPDGWLYWCDGRHGHNIKRPDGTAMAGKAARIFRCRPDGSGLEVVCGGGMDNPVEIAFTSEGEPLATVNIIENRPRLDAIFYAIDGGVYPWNEVFSEFKRTGDLLPVVGPLGWVAVSGVARARDDGLGFRDNLFTAQFNTHKVQRHVVQRDGAAFKITNEDFLSSDNPDFHATDVLEDADGSLIVIDTGGWFRIGCPMSKIAKPDITGAIYRIRRTGAPRVDDPRGLRLGWSHISAFDLAKLLDDGRFAVRDRAMDQLSKSHDAQAPLAAMLGNTASSELARRNAVWTLSRIHTDPANALLSTALTDKSLSVRLCAAHALGMARDSASLPALSALLAAAPEPSARREAATALGRLNRTEAIPALLSALRTTNNDRFLEHAILYALIQLDAPEPTAKGLADAMPAVRRGTLIAVDQMDAGNLTPHAVLPMLEDKDATVRQAAASVLASRPAWADQAAGLLRRWLAEDAAQPQRRESLRAALLSFCRNESIQSLAADALQRDTTPPATRLLVLESLAEVPLDKLPLAWISALQHCLDDRDEGVAWQAVTTTRSRNITTLDPALLRVARDQSRAADLRLAALSAAAGRLKRLDAGDFDLLVSQLAPDRPPLTRLAAAQALRDAGLDETQLARLTAAIPTAGALELPHLLAAFERGRTAPTGLALLKSLESCKAFSSLPADSLRNALKPYPSEVHDAAAPLLARLDAGASEQRAKLAELQSVLSGGVVYVGRNVFFSKTAACSTCHTVQGQGGRVGPDLSHIASIRTPQDLLEAIVFPSASFARGYEPYTVKTRDGQLHAGVISRETADAVYLATPTEERIARSEIQRITASQVSVMPQGLDAALTRQELADLIAFLKSLK